MKTEDMIRELRNVAEKHDNDCVTTGETNIFLMCREVADRLEHLCGEIFQLTMGKYEMDKQIIDIVREYIIEHLDKSDTIPNFEVDIVWKCKALQSWKYLISSDIRDGMYYEVTYNGREDEFYLDAYKKLENSLGERKLQYRLLCLYCSRMKLTFRK